MNDVLLSLFYSFGLVIFVLGVQGVIFVPLTVVYEIWKRRFLRRTTPFTGLVSIIIPAYNEERTIRATIESVLKTDYAPIEVIVVNDGSTDDTEGAIAGFISSGRIRYLRKANGGKASALNSGIELARGEVVVFTDADSVFLPDTIGKMVRWFADASIDAVCGNDAPLRPSGPIQKFLVVTTHIGTGFVRRALSVLRVIPIIAGNLGAVRTVVLREIGGFRQVWGEDLELTFRLHKYGKRIIFDPEPKVLAECPSTLSGLWKQRIRWMRSYLKISFMHRDLFFRPRYFPFSSYLPINFINMAVIPFMQISMLFLVAWAYYAGRLHFTGTIEALAFLGVIFFFFIAVYSIAIDRDWRDLAYVPYGLLAIPMSYFYNFVAAESWRQEIKRADERWHKIERRETEEVKPLRGRRPAVVICAVAIFAAGVGFYSTNYLNAAGQAAPALELAISTHYDGWKEWKKAISNILNKPDVGMARVVGVSAGRPEWVYFKWKGRAGNLSNDQKGSSEDLLAHSAATFKRSGFKVAALIDLLGPLYISRHPRAAAIGFDGKAHSEQVGFMELVDGSYGRLVIEMAEYIAANYDVDIINITETPYYSLSYNQSDLVSFKKFTGMADWPRLQNGFIDREDPAIWEWRSALMEGFIASIAERVHRHGKELYVDVPVSWKDFSRNGRDSGLDYTRILRHADNIVVWNYFDLEGLPPGSSYKLSKYLAENFKPGSYYVSIGLWGRDGAIDPASFAKALSSTIDGGSNRIWVTPNSMITPEHWREVRELLR